MSRAVMFACLLMFVGLALCLDLPQNMKPNEMPKENQNRMPQGHPQHPEPQPKFDGQHQEPPRQDNGQMPKGDKPDAKPPQEAKN